MQNNKPSKCQTCGNILTIETTYIDDKTDTLKCCECDSDIPEGTFILGVN